MKIFIHRISSILMNIVLIITMCLILIDSKNVLIASGMLFVLFVIRVVSIPETEKQECRRLRRKSLATGITYLSRLDDRHQNNYEEEDPSIFY